MMQPLSRKKRVGYLIICFILFLVLAPSIIFYATGYRISEALKISRTGGLYISTAYSGTQIFVNNNLVKETGIFQKNALVQNLKPGFYKVKVVKDGFFEWQKELRVFSETVTDAQSFMLPRVPVLEEITSTSTSQYKLVRSIFMPQTLASSTEPKILGKLSAENISGQIRVKWLGKDEDRPSYFCMGEKCKDKIMIETNETVKSFYFYPGRDDLIVLALSSGIYVSEIDDRSKQNIQPILEKANLDVRVNDNSIYIKEGKKYYFVSL